MNYNKNKPRFAIYKTHRSIEIAADDSLPLNSDLICTCYQYQSAQRIAHSAAKMMDLPWKQT